MRKKTQIALIGGARKVTAVACSAIGAGQLVKDWTDWFWVCLFFAAQWALHYAIEETLLSDAETAERDYLGDVATVTAGTVADATPSTGNASTTLVPLFPAKAEPPMPADLPPSLSTIHTIFWGGAFDSNQTAQAAEAEPNEVDEPKDDEDDEEVTEASEEEFLKARVKREDLISALRNMQLGNKQLCTEIAQHVMREYPDGSLEDWIRKALQLFRHK